MSKKTDPCDKIKLTPVAKQLGFDLEGVRRFAKQIGWIPKPPAKKSKKKG